MSLLMLFAALLIGALPSSVHFGTPEAFVCLPSKPNSVTPPPALAPFVDPVSSYYMDGIWATLPPEGRLELSPDFVVAEEGQFAHWRATKFPWTRDDGVVGSLIVTGERLDAPAPSAIDLAFDRQYGSSGFTPVLLAFPTPGCWQITGIVGRHAISFVLDVRFVQIDPWLATPVE